MKRILLLAALCLVGVSSQAPAATFNLAPGSYDVLGDFGPTGWITGNSSPLISATPTGTYDPLNGQFYRLSALATVNDFGRTHVCISNQIGFCRDVIPDTPIFNVFDPDHDGVGNLNIDIHFSWLENITVSNPKVAILLPDGFTIVSHQVAAVPEPSTWAMLLLGFAGIVFMGGRRQRIIAPSNCM
jgi:hypothetical protein